MSLMRIIIQGKILQNTVLCQYSLSVRHNYQTVFLLVMVSVNHHNIVMSKITCVIETPTENRYA